MNKLYLNILLIIVSFTVNGQQTDSTKTIAIPNNPLTRTQKYLIVGLAAHQTANFVIQYNWWWRGQEKKFNIEKDGFFDNYSLGVDKLGHFYTSYYYYQAVNELMTLAKYNEKTKGIISIALPMIWAVSIEMGDGFSPFGFSFEDLTANTLGVTYGILQRNIKPLQYLKFKMGYYPTAGYINNNFRNWVLSNDYSGHIYWLTFDMHNLVSTNYKKYFPPFLNLAIGYGVDNYGTYTNGPMENKFCIGLDWNLGSIKSKNKYIITTRNLLDYIHFPAPGIRKINGKETDFEWLLLN